MGLHLQSKDELCLRANRKLFQTHKITEEKKKNQVDIFKNNLTGKINPMGN